MIEECGLLVDTFMAIVGRSQCLCTMDKSIHESGTLKSVTKFAKKCSQNAVVLT